MRLPLRQSLEGGEKTAFAEAFIQLYRFFAADGA